MTLARLVLAWLPVAVEFVIVGRLGARFATRDRLRTITTTDLVWQATEAAVVTLFASLWFDSLGHGGWWLLFGLVGLLVGLQRRPGGPEPGVDGRGVALDVARYVLAGAILAWRLG